MESKLKRMFLHIGRLPIRANEERLRDHLSKYMKVLSVQITRNPNNGKSSGMAIVQVHVNLEEIPQNFFSSHFFLGKEILVSIAKKYSRDYSKKIHLIENITVYNINKEAPIELVREYFTKFGEIGNLINFEDSTTKRSLGIVNLVFRDQLAAERMKDSLPLIFWGLKLKVKFHQTTLQELQIVSDYKEGNGNSLNEQGVCERRKSLKNVELSETLDNTISMMKQIIRRPLYIARDKTTESQPNFVLKKNCIFYAKRKLVKDFITTYRPGIITRKPLTDGTFDSFHSYLTNCIYGKWREFDYFNQSGINAHIHKAMSLRNSLKFPKKSRTMNYHNLLLNP